MGILIKVNYVKNDEFKLIAEFRSESLFARCKDIIKKDAYESEVQLEIEKIYLEEKPSSMNDCSTK